MLPGVEECPPCLQSIGCATPARRTFLVLHLGDPGLALLGHKPPAREVCFFHSDVGLSICPGASSIAASSILGLLGAIFLLPQTVDPFTSGLSGLSATAGVECGWEPGLPLLGTPACFLGERKLLCQPSSLVSLQVSPSSFSA